MHRRLTLGIISFAIIATWLITPVAVFAQDATPTETPTEIPVEITTDVTSETVTEDPVATGETTPPVDDTMVSLTDVTNALVETANVVSSGDPSGTLSDAAVDIYNAFYSLSIPYGTAFNYFEGGVGGEPESGSCDYDATTANTFTCYWLTAVQKAVNDAEAGSTVIIESGATYNENITINSTTPIGSLAGSSGVQPIINGWISISGINGFWLGDLTINGSVTINDSSFVEVDNVEINHDADANALEILYSTDTEITDAVINKTGPFGDGIYIYNSEDTEIGETIINHSNPDGYGIHAYEANDLYIYDSEIYADEGSLGGIYTFMTSGMLEIGGDGFNMGEYSAGEGFLVSMEDPADNAVGIKVSNHEGSIMIGNGLETTIEYTSLNGASPYSATGISIQDLTGVGMIGVFSDIHLVGANGVGIFVETVNKIETGGYEIDDLTNGSLLVGEDLDVTFHTGGGDEFGGEGIGVSIADVEGQTILGSLDNWLSYIGETPDAWWESDHNLNINIEDGGTGLFITASHEVFGSNLSSTVGTYGTGAFILNSVGDVTIWDSLFNANAYGGLIIAGLDGNIWLDSVEASGNGNFGAVLAPSGCRVTVTNSFFNDTEDGAGLIIDTPDGVLIDNVEATGNDFEGINVFATSDITVQNSFLNGNGGSGLLIGLATPEEMLLRLVVPIGDPDSVDAFVYNSEITDNSQDYESAGIEYFGYGTLTVCGSTVTGNGVDMYLADPGVLNYSPYYPCEVGNTGSPKQEGIGPLVIPVDFTTDFSKGVPSGKAIVPNAQGLVFKLIETKDDGSKIIWAQASIPAGAAPTGADAGFVQVPENGLPALLPEGSTFVGAAFTLQMTDSGGSPITNLSGDMEVKFRLPDGFSVPSGQELVIFLYDASGTWVKLPVIISGGYAYVYTDALGTFVLGLSPLP